MQINYYSIFEKLNEFMGLPLVRKGRRWQAPCYIDGSPHKRKDKLTAYMKSDKIWICEQGGELMDLWKWLETVKGIKTDLEIGDLLRSESSDFVPEMKQRIEPDPKFVYPNVVAKSIRYTDKLFTFLCSIYPESLVRYVYSLYNVGSYKDKTIFWYKNAEGRFCFDKQVMYDDSGHRDKSIFMYSRFNNNSGFTAKCFFGEHLINGDLVNVVESEKTAIICKLAYPKDTFIATGGSNCLHYSNVDDSFRLLPDMDMIESWKKLGNVAEWWKYYNMNGLSPKADIADAIIKNTKSLEF